MPPMTKKLMLLIQDPMSPETWHHYNLHEAELVLSCHTSSNSLDSNCALAREMAHHHVNPALETAAQALF